MPLFGKDRRAGNLLRIHRRAGCVKIPGEGGGADKEKRRKEQKTGVMLQCFWRRREDDHISILYVKLAVFAARAAWGVMKIVACFVFVPLFLMILVISGLVYIALPILIIVGIIGFVSSRV